MHAHTHTRRRLSVQLLHMLWFLGGRFENIRVVLSSSLLEDEPSAQSEMLGALDQGCIS